MLFGSVEIKSFSFDQKTDNNQKLEYSVDMDKRVLEAYASVFNVEDEYKDIVHPGFFKRTIKERGPKEVNGQIKSKIKFGYNHEEIIGKPLHMEEDSKGLFTRSYISKTTRGNDVLVGINDGSIDQLSFMYDVTNFKPRDPKNPIMNNKGRHIGNRNLYEGKAIEYGPVDFPVNEETMMLGLQYKCLSKEAVNELKSSFVELENQFGSLEKLSELIHEIKAGRAISTRNRSVLESAISSFQSGIDGLRDLLASTDRAEMEEMQEEEAQKELLVSTLAATIDSVYTPSAMMKSSSLVSPELKSLEPLLDDFLGLSKKLRKTG